MKKTMAVFLVGLILLSSPAAALSKITPGNFIDIKGHWAENSIQSVCDLNIMSGMGSTNQGLRIFAPENLVSRSQLAVVLVRTFQLDGGQIKFIKQPLASDYYRDVDNHSWYAEAALLCAQNNIFSNTDHLYPDKPISRIELAQAVYRCFNAKGINVPMIMSMPVYHDTMALPQEEMNALVFVSNTGIMNGNRGYFHPGDTVKRGELAQIINSCLKLTAVNESLNGEEYQLRAGQNFMISLAANPSTGYQWNISNTYDQKIITLLDQSYQVSVKTDSGILGQGGHYYCRFKALQAGATELRWNYSRPWESKQPLKTFTLKVVVKPIEGQ